MSVGILYLSFIITCVEFPQMRVRADGCLRNLSFYLRALLRGKHHKPDDLYLFIFSWFFLLKESWNGAWDAVVQNASVAPESKLHVALADACEKQYLTWSVCTTHSPVLWQTAGLLHVRFLTSPVRNLWEMICRAFLLGQQFANTLSKLN